MSRIENPPSSVLPGEMAPSGNTPRLWVPGGVVLVSPASVPYESCARLSTKEDNCLPTDDRLLAHMTWLGAAWDLNCIKNTKLHFFIRVLGRLPTFSGCREPFPLSVSTSVAETELFQNFHRGRRDGSLCPVVHRPTHPHRRPGPSAETAEMVAHQDVGLALCPLLDDIVQLARSGPDGCSPPIGSRNRHRDGHFFFTYGSLTLT